MCVSKISYVELIKIAFYTLNDMKIGTLPQLFILLLVGSLCYLFWIEIAMGTLRLVSLTGNYYSDRLLGEYYAFKTFDNSKRASFYFKKAAESGFKELDDENNKFIEFLIASQYECGKGVERNLHSAEFWYEQAKKNGHPQAHKVLNKLRKKMLQKQKNELKDLK